MLALVPIRWKRMIIFAFCLIVVASPVGHSYAQTVTVFVDNVPLQTDTPAQILNNRTMVPVAAIATAFSAKVSWDEERKIVIIDDEATYIEISTRKNIAIVNGRITNMDVAATIINGRTMVPISFIANHLGLSVAWDQANYTAYITHPAFVAPITPNPTTDPATVAPTESPSVQEGDTQNQANQTLDSPDKEPAFKPSDQP